MQVVAVARHNDGHSTPELTREALVQRPGGIAAAGDCTVRQGKRSECPNQLGWKASIWTRERAYTQRGRMECHGGERKEQKGLKQLQ